MRGRRGEPGAGRQRVGLFLGEIHPLADADGEEVLAAWAGLGYYRRARVLHLAAREVTERHAGAFPRDAAGLRTWLASGGRADALFLDVQMPGTDGFKVLEALDDRVPPAVVLKP